MSDHDPRPVACWCGNHDLLDFSADYARCAACETLVFTGDRSAFDPRVRNDSEDFYGARYWDAHQRERSQYPDIHSRIRTDLPERCAYWLNALLQHRLPPARTLEIGSAHGGFVAMLRHAGFDATGLELSPAIVELARKTFGVQMLHGPIEDHALEPASFDVIALMDVLEHLPDPLATMRRCMSLLKEDGVLMIQTPCYPAGKTLAEIGASEPRFTIQLRPGEHLNLLSRRALGELFGRLGAPHVKFLQPIFWFYDMFALVSRKPIVEVTPAQRERAMSITTEGRMIQALLDGETRFRELLDNHRRLLARNASLRAEFEQVKVDLARGAQTTSDVLKLSA
jgi:SAM-dependent methyltransferase